jgi:2C-methyl-D-erythritol 2,4-cyclodiphosphate synthase
MALSLTELHGMRDALIAAIGSGTLRVEFEDRSMTYRSIAEMQAALATINKEIELAGGGATSPRQVVITPKGI